MRPTPTHILIRDKLAELANLDPEDATKAMVRNIGEINTKIAAGETIDQIVVFMGKKFHVGLSDEEKAEQRARLVVELGEETVADIEATIAAIEARVTANAS